MNRKRRRMMASEMRAQAKAWPDYLVSVPESEWPTPRAVSGRPVALWRSRFFLVQEYTEPRGVRRLSVNRVTMRSDGHWDQDITWDELQRIKREVGYGDCYAVEIYPRDRDIQHVANMRHLWLLSEPLTIGWFSESPSDATGQRA